MPRIPPIDHKTRLLKAVYDIPAGSRLLRAEAKTGDRGKSDTFLCVWYLSLNDGIL